MERNKLRRRLRFERKRLEDYFYGEKFPIKWVNGKATFERDITIGQNQAVYRLRIYVEENYPDQMPELVVCDSPKPMPKSKEWQGTHTTHTWPAKYGFLKICFYRPHCWERQNQLYQVFNKGEKWLEAYELYLENGTPMNESLRPMEPTEEEEREEKREERRTQRQLDIVNRNLAKNKFGL